MQLACEVRKPLFLHERDAHDDMVRILSKFKDRLPPAVLHCFTGTTAQCLKYVIFNNEKNKIQIILCKYVILSLKWAFISV